MNHTEYMRLWRKKNHKRWREICNKAWKKWRKNHEADHKAQTAAYRDRAFFGGLRESVLDRDEHRCANCKRTRNLSIDHIDGNRANNMMSNLQTLCFRCHGHKDGVRGWKWITPNRAVRVSI